MKEKIRADLKEASDFYDSEVFHEKGFENPLPFKRFVLSLLLSRVETGGKLLDVGCGNGNFLQFAQNHYDAYGVDFSKKAILLAKSRCDKCHFSVSPAETLKFPSGSFDAVVCLGALEHFVNMDSALKEMRRVLKKNGTAIIHVPNSNYLIHKVLGIHEHGQINERMADEREWKSLLLKYFTVEKVCKYNTKPYTQWIPKRWCCHFTFVCRK